MEKAAWLKPHLVTDLDVAWKYHAVSIYYMIHTSKLIGHQSYRAKPYMFRLRVNIASRSCQYFGNLSIWEGSIMFPGMVCSDS